MKTYPFYNVITHLKTFFDITMEDDDFENIGIHAWDLIGNKYTRTYHANLKVKNGQVELPCNADILELVTAGQEQYQSTDNTGIENYSRQYIEQWIENDKTTHNSLYARGGMLTYNRVGDTLHLDDTNVGYIRVIYKGVALDENGLPSLNFKEVEAIATYCAYIITFKKGMMTKDQATVQLAQMLMQQWQRKCDSARTPVHLTQNEMDEILDVKSSWDRKRHGVSYKLFR